MLARDKFFGLDYDSMVYKQIGYLPTLFHIKIRYLHIGAVFGSKVSLS
jgi:hypothetical protein